MKQKDKELLLKDHCARLPYGAKFEYNKNVYIVKGLDLIVTNEGDWEYAVTAKGFTPIEIDFIKPYLFHLSSMTEEQKEEYGKCYDIDLANSAKNLYDRLDGKDTINGYPMYNHIDWCNKNHFDYRGLIPMGLAIDCTNLNIY